MNLIIILFFISCAGLLFMVAVRKLELKMGRAIVPAVCRFCLDDVFAKIGFAILKIIARIQKLVMVTLVAVPHKIKVALAHTWGKIRVKIDGYFEQFHRMHISGKKGPMSSYWKSMHEHKDSLRADTTATQTPASVDETLEEKPKV